MSASLTLARKDLRDLLRERTILVALLLQLFIAAFSSFLVVGLTALYDPSRAPPTRMDVAYVGPGGFDEQLRTSPYLRILTRDADRAQELFDSGRLFAIVEETYNNASDARTVNLLLPRGELQTTLLVTQLKAELREYERQLRTARAAEIETGIVYIDAPTTGTGTYAFAYALLLPLLLIVPAFLSGAIAADALGQEIESRTLELLRSSPAGGRAIYIGKTLAPILLAPAQAALWVLLLSVNGFGISNPVPLLTLVLGVALLLVAASSLVSLVLRRPGEAQAAYSLLVLVAFLASYLLPQPTLTTFARLGAGSLTWVEIASAGATLAAGLAAWALAALLAPRALRRIV